MQVHKAAGALGAFVTDVTLSNIAEDDSLYNAVRALAIEHEVLFFRDQDVAPDVFQAFAGCFGKVLPHRAYPTVPGSEDVQVLDSTPEVPSKIDEWHSDMTFSATPPSFTLLHGQIIPQVGGDTMWASASTAYDALSQPVKNMLEPLSATHDFRHGFKESLAEPGGAQRLASTIAANPPVSHPVVRCHPETGRKVIYVNPLFATHIEGLSALESTRILEFLYRHIASVEFTVRLAWRPKTVAIWDNRSTWHKPVNDFFPAHRKLHRVTIRGSQPQKGRRA